MNKPSSFREEWLRPALFFGNNRISLVGVALTTATGVTMLGSWCIELFVHPRENPYTGILFFFLLPLLFLAGLALIPLGLFLRRRKLLRAGQIPDRLPHVNFGNPALRHGLDFVLAATMINLLIVLVASYRGASYMDSPGFCGKQCHVMQPEYTAYQVSAHAHVDCVTCHIGSGISSHLSAKLDGTEQLIEVNLHPLAHLAPKLIPDYPTPIPSPVRNLRPAREICESCHTPARFIGERLLVKSHFADDEQNSETQTVLVLHLGGRDSLSRLSGIHGVHLGHIEYIANNRDRTQIPWVEKRNADGSTTVYASSAAGQKAPSGERRVMDCIDCHNRAAHTFETADHALNRAMEEGAVSATLPWMHKKAMELLKGNYADSQDAARQIPLALMNFYKTQYPDLARTRAAEINRSAAELVLIYSQNVFPFMRVTWGTHPSHIGHMDDPGCFRCHDGDHAAKNGTSITQDCSACHNLLVVDEAKPKVLTDLGINP